MEVIDPNTGLGVTVRMRRDLPGYNVTRARNSPRLRWSLPVDIQWQSECIIKFLGQNCACCDATSGPREPTRSSDDSVTESAALVSAAKSRGMSGGTRAGHNTVLVNTQKSSVASKTSSKGKSTKADSRLPGEMTSTSFTTMTTTMTGSHGITDDVTASTDDVDRQMAPLSLDIFSGLSPSSSPSSSPSFSPSSSSPGRRRMRRRRQLVSTSDMLMAISEPQDLSKPEPEVEPKPEVELEVELGTKPKMDSLHPGKTMTASDVIETVMVDVAQAQHHVTSREGALTDIVEEDDDSEKVPEVAEES